MSRFPDCELLGMPQRSEAWNEIRRDKLTASQVGAWLAKHPHTTKKETQAQDSAICKILGAISRCPVPDEWEVDPEGPPPKSVGLWAIWNGIRLEPEAVAAFSEATGLEVESIGFCLHKSKVAGCSPDGLIVGENIGFEGKAPLPSTHVRYLLNGGLPEEYRDQVHFSMAVTGAKAWWFQSYCPGLPSLRICVARDDYTEAMAEGITRFAAALKEARQTMAEMWNSEFGGKKQ